MKSVMTAKLQEIFEKLCISVHNMRGIKLGEYDEIQSAMIGNDCHSLEYEDSSKAGVVTYESYTHKYSDDETRVDSREYFHIQIPNGESYVQSFVLSKVFCNDMEIRVESMTVCTSMCMFNKKMFDVCIKDIKNDSRDAVLSIRSEFEHKNNKHLSLR